MIKITFKAWSFIWRLFVAKLLPLKPNNAYFGSSEQIGANLIFDPRVTYCTGI
jgi:hypothetical protein